ncbi:MAG: aldo/keto reductase [Phycisphaerae bacterium]|nr:aldo/keto reductase [Phycisphaerae bacterium]
MKTTRREFLKTAGGGALVAGLTTTPSLAETVAAPGSGEMQYRPLGRTGQKVSIITLGGYHIGVPDEAEGLRIIDAAIDAGINFLDNAWKYNTGRSEERMGKALQGAKRDKVFLMTKSNVRDKKGMLKQLEDSLRRLRTDHLDLWQIHEIAEGDPEKVFTPGGAIEAVVQARKQGKIRFIGFTGHANPKYHLQMLAQDFDWDTVQMPINPADYHYLSFQNQVLPELAKRKIGVIAMKTLAFGELPRSGVVTSEECWRYVLSLPVSTVCTGCESMKALNRALAVGRSFTPMSEPAMGTLRSRTKDIAVKGKHEHYKKTACSGAGFPRDDPGHRLS